MLKIRKTEQENYLCVSYNNFWMIQIIFVLIKFQIAFEKNHPIGKSGKEGIIINLYFFMF